jgi:hypothetical protein
MKRKNHPFPPQLDRWQEEPGERGREGGKENRLRVPFSNRLCSLHIALLQEFIIVHV